MYTIFFKIQEGDIITDFKNKQQLYFMFTTWCEVTGTCLKVKVCQKFVLLIVINSNMMRDKLHSIYIC